MNRITLTAAFFFFISTNYGQQNLWPQEEAEWIVERITPLTLIVDDSAGEASVSNGFLTSTIYYSLGSPELIDGILYTTVHQNQEGIYVSDSGDHVIEYPLNNASEMVGGFRVQGEEVFYWNSYTEEESLLFDFGLQVGDSVPVSFTNQLENRVVTSIDMQMIGGVSREVFNLSGPGLFGNQIISGIGSLFGPMQEIGVGYETSFELVCFSVNGHVVFPLSSECVDDSTLSVQDDHSTSAVILYPNPTDGRLVIDLGANAAPKSIRILDAVGGLVGEKLSHEFYGPHVEWDLSHLASGSYILVFELGGSVQTTQLLIH